MATSGNTNTGKKQSRSQRRRDTENAVFSELADLLPISQDIKQDKLSVLRLTVAYLKLRGGLETDEKDLKECLESSNWDPASSDQDLDPYSESAEPPIAMLDNEGNLVAGSLKRSSPARKESAGITLPDKVLSELEDHFLSGCDQTEDNETNARKEKLQKYKEGLEKGMQDFLNQDFSYIQSHYNNPAPASGHNKEKENKLKNSQSARNKLALQATCGINKENRIHKEHEKSLNNLITKAACSAEKTDKLLAISSTEPESSLILEAATGFILSLDNQKRVLYVSENVSEFLGHCQLYMIGQDVSEFIYEKDYPELEKQMSDAQFGGEVSGGGGTDCIKPWQVRRTLYMAMKFSFQKSGSRMKDCGHQLYQWNVKLWLCKDKSNGDIHVKGLTSLCCPLQRDSIISVHDSANYFMIRFNIKETRIIYCDSKVQDLLGYSPSELIGIKHSDLKHPSDTVMCRYNYRKLPKVGHCESGYYRLLSRIGKWVWMYSNIDFIFNKNGEPDVLVMRNVIVSQGEAQCVLSREKSDFEKVRQIGLCVDLMSQDMPLSSPTLASIAFDKKRKRMRTNLGPVSTVLSSKGISSVQSATLDSLSAGASCTDRTKRDGHIPLQGYNFQPHSAKEHSSQNRKKPTRKDDKTLSMVKNQNNDQMLLQGSLTEDNSDENDVVAIDSYQNVVCGDPFVLSSAEPFFNFSDSDSSIEMQFPQHMIDDISLMATTASSSSSTQFNNSEQEWSVDSLLFDNGPQVNKWDLISRNSQEAFISDQENTLFPYSSQLKESDQLCTKSYPESLMSDEQSLGGVLDFLAEEPSVDISAESLISDEQSLLGGGLDFLAEKPSADISALIKPSSGDIMLSSLTSPQPIMRRSRPENQTFHPQHDILPGFLKLASGTKSVQINMFSGNPTSKLESTISSYDTSVTKTFSKHTTFIDTLKSFRLNKLVSHPPPTVAGQSDILYSPGKLDYPPLGTFNNYPKQRPTSSSAVNKNQTRSSESSFTTSSDRPDGIIPFSVINNFIPSSTNFQADKMLQGSVPQFGLESSVSNTMSSTTAANKKQSLNCTSKRNNSTNNQSAESIVPSFCEELFQDMPDSTNNSAEVMNSNSGFETIRKSSDFSVDVIDSQEYTDTAAKLPDDLVDLELDCDIVVGINEDWLKYL